MKDLIDDVREERSKSHMCLSASEHNDVSMILKEIVDTNFFKKDYEDVTMKLLNKKISYNDAVAILLNVSKEGLFSVHKSI